MTSPPNKDPLIIPPYKSPTGFRIGTFSSLRYWNFRFLMGGTMLMSAGNWIQQVTLGWMMFDMTHSPFLVGTLHGVRAIPFLISSPVAGVISDIIDRRKLLMLNQLFIGLIAILFAILVANGLTQVWHLFIFTFVSGMGWAFNNPVRQSLVANSVPRENLMNAIALNSMGININRFIGPAVGGLLITFFGEANNFFIQGICFLAVILIIAPINVPQKISANSKQQPILFNFVEGLKYISKEQTIAGLIFMALIPAIFLMPFITGLMPVFAEEILNAGPDGLGFLLSALGLGGLLGALILATFSNVKRRGLLLITSAVLSGLLMVVFSQTKLMPISLAVLVFLGAAHMYYMTTNNTLMQTITPDQYRGRVIGIYTLNFGLRALGGLIAGGLAHKYGSSIAIFVGGITTIILVLYFSIKFKAVRRAKIEMPDQDDSLS